MYKISNIFLPANMRTEGKMWVGNLIFHVSSKIGKYCLKILCLHFSVWDHFPSNVRSPDNKKTLGNAKVQPLSDYEFQSQSATFQKN